MSTVFGTITAEEGNPPFPITIRAFDKDMRSEELLGEVVSTGGTYSIIYSEEQFRRAEKKSADVFIRGFSEDGKLLVESKIHFNVGERINIDLVIAKSTTETSRLSELEQLQESIESVRESVEYRLFTNDDVVFLTEETIRGGVPGMLERGTIREHLEFLRLAAQFEQDTDILLAAFYGWFRQDQPQVLDELLDVSIRTLQAALVAAIGRNIIPDISQRLNEIFGQLDNLRIATGHLISHRFNGVLLNAATNELLAEYGVRAFQLNAADEPENLGSTISDSRGRFSIVFFVPREQTGEADDVSRAFRLHINDPDGVEIQQIDVTTRIPQNEVEEIQVVVPDAFEQTSIPLDELNQRTELNLPREFLDELSSRGISTLADIVKIGGVGQLGELSVATDNPAVLALDTHARLSVLITDPGDRKVLIDKGFDSPVSIARSTRAEFVTAVATLGEFNAARIQHAARAQVKLFENIIQGVRSIRANNPASTSGLLPELGEIIGEDTNCHCEDCEAAVSPAAYLADLLDYTASHIKLQSKNDMPPPEFTYKSINLKWLKDNLHQRFGDLPASCDAVDQQVRQVRICCEVLRSLIKAEVPDGVIIANNDPTQLLFERTAFYRISAYRQLLSEIGTSYEELLDVISFDTDDDQQKLAGRIGIQVQHLEELFIDIETSTSSLSEAWLEEHFGLQSTIRDPLEEGQTPLLVTWRQDNLSVIWQDLDFPSDIYSDHNLPVIDPDLIGLDDFRRPEAGQPAFELWRTRRENLDARLTDLTSKITNGGLQPVLIEIFSDPPPDVVALSKLLTEDGLSDDVSEALQLLHLTPESVSELADLKARENGGLPLTEDEISTGASILAQVEKQQHFAEWIDDEHNSGVVLDPRIFWFSLREPAEGIWPPIISESTPLIDPQLIELKDLAEPTAGKNAIQAWEARQARLEEDFDTIRETRENGGFQMMLELALGHPLPSDLLEHDMEQLQSDLLSTDDIIASAAEAAITDDLHLTIEDFNFLMLVRAKDANPEPVDKPMLEEWQELYMILTTAKKQKHRYPTWVVEETQPELSPYWKILKARLPRWRADFEARQVWQQALLARTGFPLIEPSILKPIDINKTSLIDPPYSLWKDRGQWVSDRSNAIDAVRQDAATPFDAINQMLIDEETLDMPVVGLDVDELLALHQQHEQGEDISARLDQLTLEVGSYNYLVKVIDKVQKNIEATDSEWKVIRLILIDVAKRRHFAEWRREEQAAGLYLGPNFFKLNKKPSIFSSQPLPTLRASRQARRDWEAKLEARIDQMQAIIVALQESVSATEEDTLPLLRDTLIKATSAQGGTLDGKAEWITDRLMIDAKMGGCRITTRVSQAIESLQILLWGIRTGQLRDSRPNWVLDADDFDEEWRWIGSYATWRAAMFVFMYPENISIPSLRPWQTPPFRAIVNKLRSGRVTADSACQAAHEYSEYFKDVCRLSLDASCRARTRIHDDKQCQQVDKATYRNLYYLFGRSTVSDKIYWSVYDFGKQRDQAQSFWREIPGIDNIVKIIGAVPYSGFIFLFAILKERDGARRLVFTRYDLELSGEWEAVQDIEWPLDESTSFATVVAQRSSISEPPLLVASIPWIYSSGKRELRLWKKQVLLDDTQEDTDTDEEEDSTDNGWTQFEVKQSKIFLENLPESHRLKPSRVLALARLSNGYVLVTRYTKTEIDNRLQQYFFSHVLDNNLVHQFPQNKFTTQDVLKVTQTNKKFHGFWRWPGTDLFVFLFEETSASYFTAYQFKDDFQKYFQFRHSLSHLPSLEKLGKIATHCDDDESGKVKISLVIAHSLINISGEQSKNNKLYGIYLSIIKADLDPRSFTSEPITFVKRIPVAPQVLNLFGITEQLSEQQRLLRRYRMQKVFADHEQFPEPVVTYLREAYFFVPIHLALRLQQKGHYLAALDWFRIVYDYSLPTYPENYRKIYFGLTDEEDFSKSFKRQHEWLLDPLNPHTIAATRVNTYTRFTLLSIIRCLLDYGDAEFTRDTVESVARALVLYETALDLLNADGLKQTTGQCKALIGSIKIEVGEPWREVLLAQIAELDDINDIDHVRELTASISAVANNRELQDEDKVSRISSIISTAKSQQPAPQTFAAISQNNRAHRAQTHQQLLAQTGLMSASRAVVGSVETDFSKAVGSVAGLGGDVLDASRDGLAWLAAPLPMGMGAADRLDAADNGVSRTLTFRADFNPMPQAELNQTLVNKNPYIPVPSFEFCIPPNPVLKTLRMRAENNLFKLRHCRNIAGIERELEPYAAPTDTVTGLPMIGAGGQLILPGVFTIKPTQYRYKILVERAKQLVQLAVQIEAAMLSALEKRDAEAYQVLKARHEINLARAGIRLQNLRVKEARSGVDLAELQRDRALIQVDHFQNLIDQDRLEQEDSAIKFMWRSWDLQIAAASASFTASGLYFRAAQNANPQRDNLRAFFASQSSATSSGLSSTASTYSTRASILFNQASFERMKQDWQFQKTISEYDVGIGDQQVNLAEARGRIVDQELDIAKLQADNAQETMDFLINKFTNVELYDWMSNVLEGVYSFFLEQATSNAKIAENQLAFERQEVPLAIIKEDYWGTPDSVSAIIVQDGDGKDRRGLTGSARLLQDIYQLDQYAFETDKRKLQLSKTISLAKRDPIQFQRFRETGVITFATPMEMFNRDFPGHYLRLVKRVRTTVIALIPPSEGIHATLSTVGTSRVVIGDDFFQTVVVKDEPKSIALSAPSQESLLFDLDSQSEMLLPFEGMGVDTTWELRMPKTANQIDFRTIADALITIEFTALNSFDYRQQVLQELNPTVSADRSFSFRHELADQWYDLHNPDQTSEPMVVRFETRREDFPPNIDELRIEHVVLYAAFADSTDEPSEFEVSLHFTEEDNPGTVGGSSQTIDGVSSTRRGNAAGWMPMIGKRPFGQWTLAITDTPEIRQRFANEEIQNILFIVTYRGMTPPWPN